MFWVSSSFFEGKGQQGKILSFIYSLLTFPGRMYFIFTVFFLICLQGNFYHMHYSKRSFHLLLVIDFPRFGGLISLYCEVYFYLSPWIKPNKNEVWLLTIHEDKWLTSRRQKHFALLWKAAPQELLDFSCVSNKTRINWFSSADAYEEVPLINSIMNAKFCFTLLEIQIKIWSVPI